VHNKVKRFEHKSQRKESNGERGMVVPRDVEEALKFTPFLKGSDATVKKVGRNQISPYKVALVVQDFLVICLAFGLGAFINGHNFFVWEDPAQFGSFFILSLMIIAFFGSGKNI